MSGARRAVAALVGALVLWHGTAAIQAFELDPIVHCCCGDHEAGHDCGCPDCPVPGGLRWTRAPAHEAPSPTPAVRPCAGRASPRALPSLVVLALAAPPPTVAAPAAEPHRLAPPLPLRDRRPPPVRPPPEL